MKSIHLRKSPIIFVLLISTVAFAAKLPSADTILGDAKAKAGAENKNVMLVFESSWCPPCHQFDRFVADHQIRKILDQYFVLATIAVGEEAAGDASKNNPGSEELLVKLGGVHSGNTGVPFIFIIDPKGTTIVTSERPIAGQKTGDNVGYPTEPEEIDWFVKMMKKGAPALTQDEARTVEAWLRRDSES
jgi:thioredoxin-related protein